MSRKRRSIYEQHPAKTRAVFRRQVKLPKAEELTAADLKRLEERATREMARNKETL